MEKRNVFYSIVAFAIMLTLAMFTSCDKALESLVLMWSLIAVPTPTRK